MPSNPIPPLLAGAASLAGSVYNRLRPNAETPGLARIDGVEIFECGKQRDKVYTEVDLDQMAQNFAVLSTGPAPVLQPPVVLGHEEDQELLDRSDLPAAGWPKRVYREGRKLKADFGDVPPEIARLVNQKAYRKVSAEIYDDFVAPDGKHYGKTLRRIALLGGEIPQVKTLADLPPAKFSDKNQPRTVVTHKLKAPLRFAEEKPRMTPDEMKAKLLEAGMDQAIIDSLTPEQMAEFLRIHGTAAPVQTPDAAMADPGAGGVATTTTAAAAQTAPAAPAQLQPSLGNPQRQPNSITMKFSELTTGERKAFAAEVAAALAPDLGKRIEPLQQQVDQFMENTKKANITAFLESQLKAGKVLPAELDRSDPSNLFDELMRADGAKPVLKYKEGKDEKTATELDLKMRAIGRRPSFASFGDRLKSPPGAKPGDLSNDEEVQKVQKFAEDHADELAKGSVTVASFVDTFKKQRAKNPKFTASHYGVAV